MNTNKILNIMGLASLAIAAILLAAHEWGYFLCGDIMGLSAYAIQLTVVALTIIAIPLSLRMMSTQYVRNLIQGRQTAYLKLAALRLGLVVLVILLGVIAYAAIQDTSMLFCAGIGVISLMYIWPTQQRQDAELQATTPQE